MSGTSIRMRRLFPASGRRLFGVPLDHPVSMGPIDGLESTARTAEALLRGGADLLVAPRGTVRELEPVLRPTTLLGIHLSASTNLSMAPDAKVLVGSAGEAAALGADLVSVQVNFGPPQEAEMLRDLGVVVDQCRALGLPLMCMAYVKRPTPPTPEEIRHAARAVADLGADIVKTSYPGSLEEMRRLVRSTPVPVLLGGGVRSEDPEAFLSAVRDSVLAGGAGVCAGRNLFQQRDVESFARRVAQVLHAGPGA